jgi:hypothetical protein
MARKLNCRSSCPSSKAQIKTWAGICGCLRPSPGDCKYFCRPSGPQTYLRRRRGEVLSRLLQFLFLGQDQELRIGGENLAHGVLELAPGPNAPAHFIDPSFGYVLHVLHALHHKGERPSAMPGVFRVGAVAGRFAAAQVTYGKRARQQIRGDRKAVEKFEFALAEASGLGAFGFGVQLPVYIPEETKADPVTI